MLSGDAYKQWPTFWLLAQKVVHYAFIAILLRDESSLCHTMAKFDKNCNNFDVSTASYLWAVPVFELVGLHQKLKGSFPQA